MNNTRWAAAQSEAVNHVKRKLVILVFVRFYLPGYRAGGPIRTIANLVDRLGDEFDFRVVAKDRDSGDLKPYSGVTHFAWTPMGKGSVCYVPGSGASFSQLKTIIEDVGPDVLYLNSFFDTFFTQKILLLRRIGQLPGIPVVLAPRGEFSDGALGLKRLKKALFIRLVRHSQLVAGVVWQVSSEFERADLLRSLRSGTLEVHVAENLSARSDFQPDVADAYRADVLRVCFLARISPMKNLDFALRALSFVQEPIEFAIYGPVQDRAHWNNCLDIIATLPKNVKVVHYGEVPHAVVRATLAQHDLFFLPTRGENYGHVIFEALAVGVPVLISDRTPWQDLEDAGAGWVVSLDSEESHADVIDRVARMSGDALLNLRRCARAYADKWEAVSPALEANRSLFNGLIRDRA